MGIIDLEPELREVLKEQGIEIKKWNIEKGEVTLSIQDFIQLLRLTF